MMLGNSNDEKSSDFLHDYLQKTDLSSRATLNQYAQEHRISREENETDEDFTKRVKKINYLNLAQQLIRQSARSTTKSSDVKSPTHASPIKSLPKSTNKPMAPLKRMKPVFSPAEDPDFDDEFEDQTRDIYDESSSSSDHDNHHDDDDDDDDNNDDDHNNYGDDYDDPIRLRSQPFSKTKTYPSTHNFANDIKQKLSSLAADVVRTFGTSTSLNDDDLTKPIPSSQSFSSRLFPQRNKEITLTNPVNSPIEEATISPSPAPATEPDEGDADLLYTNESLLPQVDWENLERQLKRAQVERERYDKARLNDRDEIRRKLAAGNESENENEDYYTSDYIKKTMGTTSHRRRQGSNLQICFVNEHHQTSETTDHETGSNQNTNMKTKENPNEDILTKQQRLQEEAKVALVLGAKMARMQAQIERRAAKKKKSPLYDIIGIRSNDDKPLTLRMLEEMNIGQLQVIVNDLHGQIETHNDELVKLLMERDSLSMEQDSVLVDIEDLTKRLQECAASQSSDSKRAAVNNASQRVYIVKSSPTQPATPDSQKKSLLHNLLRKATFI